MSLNRTASRVTPVLLRGGARAFRRTPRAHRDIPAIAILIPHRFSSTETSTSGGGANFPPPGFNAEQAKKPLPKEQQKTTLQDKSVSSAKHESSAKDPDKPDTVKEIGVPRDGATSTPKTKAAEDQSLSELAAEKAAADKAEDRKVAEKKKEDKKLTIWQKIKKEAAHYWDGTKLLATEVRISSKLALKMAAGYELTRRENRQLQRTVQDLARLVPFSVFVIVPFAELLLPIALKLFPNLLPSTYEAQKSKDAKATSLRATRKEVSNFLRQTLKETGLPVTAANAQREEFTEFFRKVRSTGESPTKADVIKVCKIFKDDLTLDNLSRPQLVGMCRYMNLNTFGTDALLRYQIRHRMRQTKRDDKAISYEGVDSLSVPELQSACASRGIRTHGVSPARLREDLQLWLDLRLKYGVPSTLLVLSNAFMYAQGKDTELDSQIDALQAVLASIPEELFHEIELEVHTAEGAATNKQRLEVLKEQQELIKEEAEQSQVTQGSSSSTPKDDQDIDEKEEREEREAEKEADMMVAKGSGKDSDKA
ncbi:LETM1 domain-containing protein ylh47 [Coniosporium apollinis]|uniref:LETM1 domain-containing protein ylh47 n=2 Tax=Coniosporium TaxID=2810619 RepID=A0ABQ9P7V4_9PEZI|nr:LETM1 domain-containing protein ylh47 [Cladosporium sp. JES 115]KAJ9668963.1 LETM1 domain-containing protein ylh47 [Coniosporium apollinis]